MARRIRLTGSRWLVTRPVPEAQQSAVELRQDSCVRAVQDHLPKLWEPHQITSSKPCQADILANLTDSVDFARHQRDTYRSADGRKRAERTA